MTIQVLERSASGRLAPQILRSDNPTLRQVAKPVERGLLVHKLLDDMRTAMAYPAGIGLAAPQIGESLRVIVVEVPHGRETIRYELINPEVYWCDEKTALAWEGCLSFRHGFRAMVPRSVHIKVRAFDRLWKPLDFGARDLVARVIQHECDHLDGVLITDKAVRIDDRKTKDRT